MFQVVGGCSATKLIFTMDLMLLKPYFQGTTNRIGAPSCGGRVCPYKPVARIVSGCIASSSRNPSTYGQSRTPVFWLGMRFGAYNVWKATYFACDVGSTLSSNFDSGKPIHGITIDQRSTQRNR